MSPTRINPFLKLALSVAAQQFGGPAAASTVSHAINVVDRALQIHGENLEAKTREELVAVFATLERDEKPFGSGEPNLDSPSADRSNTDIDSDPDPDPGDVSDDNGGGQR